MYSATNQPVPRERSATQTEERSQYKESRERSDLDRALEQLVDPIAGSLATGKILAEVNTIFVDDLFGTGGKEMEQRVLSRLRKDFQVGSEDWSDVIFTGQRIRWTVIMSSETTLR